MPGGNLYCQAQFLSTMQGQQFASTFAFKFDPTAPLAPDIDAHRMADEIDTWLGALYALMVTVDGTLDTIKVTTIPAAYTDVRDVYEKNVARAGGRDNSGDQLPDGMVAWNKASTSVALRGAHGGWFSLPAVRRLNLTSAGVFDTGTTFWTSQTNFNNALTAGFDYGPLGADGHASYVIYSRTRHKRAESSYLWDVSGISRSSRPHWLRSRDS